MNRKVLHELYPFEYSYKKVLSSSLLFGLFVFLFLSIFQPFGLSNYHSDQKVWQLLGYGIVTTVTLFGNFILFRFLFPKWFCKGSWTVLKNILYTMWVLLTIGTGNLIYSNYLGFFHVNVSGFLYFQLLTVLVGVFPMTISTLIIYHKQLRKSLSQAFELNSDLSGVTSGKNQFIEIPSQNKSEKVTLKINQLLAIKAVENYVELYTSDDSSINKELIRNTLKNIQATLSQHKEIRKCHRSYLVNLKNVGNFSGNAQGLTLSFSVSPEMQIPVSRSYVKEIKEQLQKNET